MDDIRTSKTVNGVTYEFLNLNGRVARQSWLDDGVFYRIDFIYDQQGKPLTLRYKVGDTSYTYYCLTNLQGDVIKLYQAKLVDSKLVTTEVASYTYDAWGNVTDINRTAADTQDIAHLNPIRYRGYYQDVETGFYYLESRYYDPAIGRFINADNFASTGTGFLGFNMFAYCLNNPLVYLDPSGKVVVSWEDVERDGLHTAVCYALYGPPKPSSEGIDRANAPATSYNCYGNAIGRQSYRVPPTFNRDVMEEGDYTDILVMAMRRQVGAENMRPLDSPKDPINEDENLVVLNCGETDAHFVVRIDGVWHDKHGDDALVVSWSLDYVESQVWTYKGHVYDEGPVFIALKKEWWLNP